MSASWQSPDRLRGLVLAVAMVGATACSRTAPTYAGTSVGESSSTTSDSTTSDSTTSSDTTTSDTTETNQTSTTTETDTGVTTQGFVPVTEFGNESCQCDPFLQDCPEEEKCVAYASPRADGIFDCVKCVEILGDGEPGEPCVYGGTLEATDDCGPASYCFNVMDVDGQSIGECMPFCEGTPDDPICPMGTDCLIANHGDINLCVATCDPLMQDCAPGLGCFFEQNYEQ
jgi:hypothetical protein